MKANLAILVAVVVVFAPGWGGDLGPEQALPSPDVAARILAPTFDEAVDRGAGSVHNRLERHSSRGDTYTLVTSTPVVPALQPRELVLAALVAVALIAVGGSRRPHVGRAPPLLATV